MKAEGGRGKGEGGRRKAEGGTLSTIHYPPSTNHCPLPTSHYPLPTIHYPLSTIHHSFAAGPSHSGITLLEVLVSLFVLSVGLLGVVSLVPLGALLMRDAVKADSTGACGRAAIHDVKVRRMLDPGWWYSYTAPTPPVPFVIDPLGAISTGSSTIGALSRINLRSTYGAGGAALNAPQAAAIFQWHDDLSYVRAKD